MTLGTRLMLPVWMVAQVSAAHSTAPPTRTSTQGRRRAEPALGLPARRLSASEAVVVLKGRLEDVDQLDQALACEPDAGQRVDRHARGAARLLTDLLGSPDDRRPGHLAHREDELVRLVLDEEVVGEDDRQLLEVDPFEGADLLVGRAHHRLSYAAAARDQVAAVPKAGRSARARAARRIFSSAACSICRTRSAL